jgi:peroxiredoxin Q/BCP
MVDLMGKKAPDASLLSSTGDKIALKDYKGSYIVLYFYPKDDTPGCTTEACDFRDNLAKLKKENVVVLGVSKDSLKAHEKFVTKYDLTFPLLSDEEGKLLEAYGVWVEKSMYGKKYMGIERATFLIDPSGKVAHVWRNVKVTGHVDEVLKTIKAHKKLSA